MHCSFQTQCFGARAYRTTRQSQYAFAHGRLEWIKANEAHIKMNKVEFSSVVVDDVRYDNECEWIKSKGGYIIGVDRPGLEDGQASWREHPSEGGISEHLIDQWISNISCYQTDLEYATMNVMHNLLGPEKFVEA